MCHLFCELYYVDYGLLLITKIAEYQLFLENRSKETDLILFHTLVVYWDFIILRCILLD